MRRAAAPPASRRGSRGHYQIKALDHLMALLECFSRERPEAGVSELSRELNMHKATVHRMLMALEEYGLMEQDQASGRYRLGLRLLELGTRVSGRLDLLQAARPVLQRLVSETQESAHVVVRYGDEGFYLDKYESSRLFRMPSLVGRHLPLHCTAAGKAILANLPEADAESIIRASNLLRLTENTITDPQLLKRELVMTRERGYSLDNEEAEVGLRCIGAPVFNFAGRVVAAISIAGPAARITAEVIPSLAQRVISASAAVSERLGAAQADEF